MFTTQEKTLNKSGSVFEKEKKKGHSKTSPHRSKKIFMVIFICLGCVLSLNLGTRIYFKDKVIGSAEWRTSNSQSYLYIDAEDSYSLGYLTGVKLWQEIWALKLLLYTLAPLYHSSYSQLNEMAKNYIPFIPTEMLDEMRGITHGASYASGFYISFEDILIQNVWYDVFYGRILPDSPGPMGCTAVGAVNADNTTTIGQNFDLNPPFYSTLSFVLHKLGDKPAIFGLRLGGGLNLPMAKNELNVSVLVTLVQSNVYANI